MNSRNVKINFHPGFWGLKPSFGLTVAMSTSVLILLANFLHAMVVGNAEDFQILVLEQL